MDYLLGKIPWYFRKPAIQLTLQHILDFLAFVGKRVRGKGESGS